VRHHRHATLAWSFAALSALVCAALLAAAVLVPAPLVVLPFLIAACVGCPMAAAYQLARTLSDLRDPAAELRRELERLPEAPHPLGL
jgi:Flp pilus assembly protein TadB